MAMHADWAAAIIANDLDSMILRIEALPASPYYTQALCAVQTAKAKIIAGRSDLHRQDMARRHPPL